MSGVFLWLNKVTEALSDATLAGCSFLFGYLGGGPLPFAPHPARPRGFSPSSPCP
ncbi:MAG: hypothetical protein V8Q84_06475 [Bilophila sp.]